MAQSLPADVPAETPAEPPRSAMGRVMGIMIESLRQDAMRNDASAATAGKPIQVIEVGGAFQLQADAPVAPVEVAPACDVQPCDRAPVPNLRIASQK